MVPSVLGTRMYPVQHMQHSLILALKQKSARHSGTTHKKQKNQCLQVCEGDAFHFTSEVRGEPVAQLEKVLNPLEKIYKIVVTGEEELPALGIEGTA